MAVNPDDPTIVVNCTDPTPPAGITPTDCEDPEINYGPIVNLYEFSEPFTTAPTALEITTRLDNVPAAPGDTIIGAWGVGPFICEIARAAPSETNLRYNGRDIPTPTDLLYNVDIKNTKDAYYEYARTTQRGGRPGYFYGVDANGNWFGGQNGMTGGKGRIKLRNILPTGEKDAQSIVGTISGQGFFDDKRIASPIPVVFAE